MSIATYFQDAGEFSSASEAIYRCGRQEDDMTLLMAYATQFKEDVIDLEKFINSILENYSVNLKEEIKNSVKHTKVIEEK